MLRRFGEHLCGAADVGHRQVGELRAGGTVGNRLDHHIGRLTGTCAGRCTGVAQLQALQRQPRLRRLCRLCLYLQRAVGAGGIHPPVAAAKEVVGEATGTAPTETRTGQPKCTAALRNQQEAPLDHVVAAAIDLPHIGAVIAHPLQRRTGRGIQHQFAGGQLRSEIQPHHHAYALLHIRRLVIDDGFDEGHCVAVGAGHGSGIHLQGQRRSTYAAHLQARHHQCTATPRRECHAIQIALLHAAIAPLHLTAAGLAAEIEVGTQRREVWRALIALDIEGDRVAHRDAVAVQPRARLRPRQQRQPQQ